MSTLRNSSISVLRDPTPTVDPTPPTVVTPIVPLTTVIPLTTLEPSGDSNVTASKTDNATAVNVSGYSDVTASDNDKATTAGVNSSISEDDNAKSLSTENDAVMGSKNVTDTPITKAIVPMMPNVTNSTYIENATKDGGDGKKETVEAVTVNSTALPGVEISTIATAFSVVENGTNVIATTEVQRYITDIEKTGFFNETEDTTTTTTRDPELPPPLPPIIPGMKRKFKLIP